MRLRVYQRLYIIGHHFRELVDLSEVVCEDPSSRCSMNILVSTFDEPSFLYKTAADLIV